MLGDGIERGAGAQPDAGEGHVPSAADAIEAFDWASTSLGPAAGWPQSLRTAVSIALGADFPMLLAWGRDFIQIYNEAFIPIVGRKHPRAIGQSTPECFPELWKSTVGPLFEQVMGEGRAVAFTDELMPLDRAGYLEESYFTFSYSPVRDDEGRPAGVFVTCSEVTERVIGQRRLRALRDLAAVMTETRSFAEIASAGVEVLAADRRDIAFLLLYLVNDENRARLHASVGCARSSDLAPEVLHDAIGGAWPITELLRGRGELQRVRVRIPAEMLEGAPWPEPVVEAAMVAIPQQGAPTPAGVLVVGLSPRLDFDAHYEQFLRLGALQLAQGFAAARARDEAQKRAQQLVELDRAKTAFFSNISHEFRTPMMLMLGPLEELLATADEELSPSQRQKLDLAHGNCVRLRKLVDTLLEFSRVEAGRSTARFEPTDLASLTSELSGAFRSAMDMANLRFAVDCPPLSGPVFVDRGMWERVVLNLLSNALKFTFAGEVVVSLRAEGQSVRLLVRDTGIGIPPDELEHVFERFHRGKHFGGRTIEGSGIGLPVVKDIVDLHGGTIEVRSALGAGSEVCVTVPLGADHLPANAVDRLPRAWRDTGQIAPYVEEALRWMAPRDGARPAPRSSRGVVLVVDDSGDMREYLARLLGDRYDVLTAADGESALAIAARETPDLVLADRMMPRLDGLQLLRALRERAETQTIPIIILSAQADEESRMEGLRAGADDYLVKPFVGRELIARIDSQLTLARIRRRAEVQERELRAGVQEANEELERRVQERTAELVAAERALREYTDRLTQLSRQLLTSQESERRRIARDLHDEIGQALTLIQLNLQVAHDATSDGPIARAIDDTVAIVEGVLRQVRDLSLELRPSILDDLGLAPALRWYIDRVRQSSGLLIDFHVEPALSSARWSTEIETACFRVAQEALSNVIRHAQARYVEVALGEDEHGQDDPEERKHTLRLRVCDDGVGFDADAARTAAAQGTSMGLLNMEERMKLVGGSLSVASTAVDGTCIEATVRPVGSARR